MKSDPYKIIETDIDPRPVAGIRAVVPFGRVAEHFGRYLDRIYAAGRAGDVALDGQNIFIYRGLEAGQLTVDFCVGVTKPFAGAGEVMPLTTPSGPVAMTTHRGDYGRLGAANEAIRDWCRAQGRSLAGPSWEVYGHWTDDPAQLTTDVYYLLAK